MTQDPSDRNCAGKQNTSTTGKKYETLAEHYLRSQGLRSIERNFNCPQGEIDLIMLDKDTLVFIEVKYRRSASYGSNVEQVNHHKKKKLRNAALAFISQNSRYTQSPCRFDILGISPGTNGTDDINWIRNALEYSS